MPNQPSSNGDGKAVYPKRPPFFAHRFCRLLTKAAAAQEIGPEACWLLTIIAHQEDAKRYRGPVTFWNEQVMPLCGFGGRSRLVAARVKAVEAGWLHYDGGGKGRPGVYWVLIPAGLEDLADTPCDETPDDICRPESGQQTDGNEECRPESGRNSGRQPDGNRTANLHHSTLTLNRTPNKRAHRGGSVYSVDFDAWWQVYPKKEGKRAAWKAYQDAVHRIAEQDSGDVVAAQAKLLNRVKAFAVTPKGQAGRFCPSAATWLNQDRFDDDPSAWQHGGETNGKPRQASAGSTYDETANYSSLGAL